MAPRVSQVALLRVIPAQSLAAFRMRPAPNTKALVQRYGGLTTNHLGNGDIFSNPVRDKPQTVQDGGKPILPSKDPPTSSLPDAVGFRNDLDFSKRSSNDLWSTLTFPLRSQTGSFRLHFGGKGWAQKLGGPVKDVDYVALYMHPSRKCPRYEDCFRRMCLSVLEHIKRILFTKRAPGTGTQSQSSQPSIWVPVCVSTFAYIQWLFGHGKPPFFNFRSKLRHFLHILAVPLVVSLSMIGTLMTSRRLAYVAFHSWVR